MQCYDNSDFALPTVMSLSLTATSVTIGWFQPADNLAANNYTIFLNLTDSNQQLCPTVEDSRQMTTNATSMNFIDLQEFNIYTVTVSARVFGVTRTSTPHEFTTLPAGTYSE